MERKTCFGSIKEVTLNSGMTMTQTRPECRDCADFRDCLFHLKMKDETAKQDMIATIIDHSEVHSNEIGSCLLDFLNRIYTNPIGTALFRNLLVFYEVLEDDPLLMITVPLSRPLVESVKQGKQASGASKTGDPRSSEESLLLRIILLNKRFPNNRKANMGFIAHQVANVFANQLIKDMNVPSEEEARAFRKMDMNLRINWIVQKWGFQKNTRRFSSK